MSKREIENNLTEAETLKAGLCNEMAEIADRISFLELERKSLTFSVKHGDPEATTQAKKIDSELTRLRKTQEQTAEQLADTEKMIEAICDDRRAAEFGEAQIARDRAALAVVEGWIKLYTLQQEEQETANEIDRRKAEAKDAETKLRSLAVRDVPIMIPYDPPIQLAEPANKLVELHHRRSELMTRLEIG